MHLKFIHIAYAVLFFVCTVWISIIAVLTTVPKGLANSQLARITNNLYRAPYTLTRSVSIKTVANSELDIPQNFVTTKDTKARKVAETYYKFIKRRQPKKIAPFSTGPELAEVNSPQFEDFVSNIKELQVIEFKDVTAHWGMMPIQFDRFYKVKVYGSLVNIEVYNVKKSRGFVGRKVMRFFVVKNTPSSPWKLFMAQGMSPQFVPESWEFNLSGVTGFG